MVGKIATNAILSYDNVLHYPLHNLSRLLKKDGLYIGKQSYSRTPAIN